MNWESLTRLVIGLALLTLLCLILMGCQTTGSVATSSTVACQAFKPIYWSKLDTVDTAKQAREHNAVWKALCEKTGKVPTNP